MRPIMGVFNGWSLRCLCGTNVDFFSVLDFVMVGDLVEISFNFSSRSCFMYFY